MVKAHLEEGRTHGQRRLNIFAWMEPGKKYTRCLFIAKRGTIPRYNVERLLDVLSDYQRRVRERHGHVAAVQVGRGTLCPHFLEVYAVKGEESHLSNRVLEAIFRKKGER
ncbi:MAG: hypothetical protein PHZ19_05010 [Candidatus Thermoplasmatota archaeon]|nr:hypothetical protein [Candidatus Thermoplasmatota archaeon]